jgi:hypothetical protein
VIAWLAGDHSRIARLQAVVARVLSVVVPTTLARSSVAPIVLCPTLIVRRRLRLGLILAGYNKAIVASCIARVFVWLHRLLLQIGGV